MGMPTLVIIAASIFGLVSSSISTRAGKSIKEGYFSITFACKQEIFSQILLMMV